MRDVSLLSQIKSKIEKIAKLEADLAAERAELAEIRNLLGDLDRITSDSFALRSPAAVDAIPSAKRSRGFRPGSSVSWSAELIREAGHPLHVDLIINQIQERHGQAVAKQTLVSNLARLVKQHDTFTRTAPNTFGLIEQAESAA